MEMHKLEGNMDLGKSLDTLDADILTRSTASENNGNDSSKGLTKKLTNDADSNVNARYCDKSDIVNNLGSDILSYPSNDNPMKRNLNRSSSMQSGQPINFENFCVPMRNLLRKEQTNKSSEHDMVDGSHVQQNIYAYSSEDESETDQDTRVVLEGHEHTTEVSDQDLYAIRRKSADKVNMQRLLDCLSIAFSGMYGIFIVVFGAVIPMAESFADPSFPFVFEAFYVYLYVTSIVFLLYVYLFILRKNSLKPWDIMKTMSRSLSFNKSVDKSETGMIQHRRTSPHLDEQTGSFYLRLGALVFGVGSMIHSGLHFGQYFQLFDGSSSCNQAVQAIKPFCHLVFSFIQLYFIFLNSKICMHQSKTITRLGLMHMCGTNICVWFRCIVVETLSVIHQWNTKEIPSEYHANTTIPSNWTTVHHGNREILTINPMKNDSKMNSLPELTCQWGKLMGKVVQDAGPYLYPCTIEYSLICAGVLYVMWSNVGCVKHARTVPAGKTTNTLTNDNKLEKNSGDRNNKNKHRMSVDCSNSSKGLFCGILVSVGAIISMIAFYVMVNEDNYIDTAVAVSHLSETVMYVAMTIASLLAGERMYRLRFDPKAVFGLEENLLVISFTGLVMFGVFSIIPVIYNTDSSDGALTIVTNVSMILQASIQVVLLLATSRMYVLTKEEEKGKPGRQFITFLILCNFAMWTLNTFETRKPEHNPLQIEFYGAVAWAIFTHISVPLGIFFRFHSSVYLANIWKRAWKLKKNFVGSG